MSMTCTKDRSNFTGPKIFLFYFMMPHGMEEKSPFIIILFVFFAFVGVNWKMRVILKFFLVKMGMGGFQLI